MHYLIVSLILFSYVAHAEVRVGRGPVPSLFKVNDKDANPVEARQAVSTKSNKVERCTVVKNVITQDGKPAYRCKQVDLEINPITGADRWVSK